MTDQATNEAILNVISVLLVLAAGAVCLLYWVAYKMEQGRVFLRQGEQDTDPQPAAYQPDPDYIKRILEEWELRKPLPVYRSTHGAAQAYNNEANAADLARGTSDNLLIAAARDLL